MDSSSSNTKPNTKLCIRGFVELEKAPNFMFLLFCQMFSIAASLFDHILSIVSMGSNKQMCRIYAARIIAAMENEKSTGNLPKMQLPRETMGNFRIVPSTRSNFPIPLRAFASYPFPTGRSLINFVPETLRHWFRLRSFCHNHSLPLNEWFVYGGL